MYSKGLAFPLPEIFRILKRSKWFTSGVWWQSGCRERVLYRQPTCPNPLNHRDDFNRAALRQGSLNSLCWQQSEFEFPLLAGVGCIQPTPTHTVEYDPSIKSQLALSNQIEGLIWCKFGHVPRGTPRGRKQRTPPCGWTFKDSVWLSVLEVRTAPVGSAAIPSRALRARSRC